MQPERVRISGGVIEIHPTDHVTVTRQPDGTTSYSQPQHRSANIRVHLDSEDGFFAFDLSAGQAALLAAAVPRVCPDAI
jgi:hypothetical protein